MGSHMIDNIVESSKKSTSGIWLIIGMGLTGVAIFFTAKGTIKSVKQVEKAEADLGRKLTKREIVKVTWKNYIPAAGAAVASGVAYFLGHKEHLKKEAVFATGYAVSQATLNEYQNKTREIVGEEKEKEIRESIAKDRITKSESQAPTNVVYSSGLGDLFIDDRTGREFISTINRIDAAVNRINRQLMIEMFVPLNDFYYELGLSAVDTDDGWHVDDGLIEVNYIPDIANGSHPALRLSFPDYCKPKPEKKYY